MKRILIRKSVGKFPDGNKVKTKGIIVVIDEKLQTRHSEEVDFVISLPDDSMMMGSSNSDIQRYLDLLENISKTYGYGEFGNIMHNSTGSETNDDTLVYMYSNDENQVMLVMEADEFADRSHDARCDIFDIEIAVINDAVSEIGGLSTYCYVHGNELLQLK